MTVVICTRDRPRVLQRVLASLVEQTIERSRFEVVVVDNGGGVEELARRAGADLVVREHVPGLSRARNAGWRAASAGLVAFIDDDAIAAPDWLDEALRVYAERGHEPAVLGGPVLPLWETPAPSWFPESREHRWFGDVERVLSPGESLSGSNVFFSRKELERLGGFDIRLGLIGDRLAVGEETELFHRLWLQEPPPLAVYSPAIVVRHPVAPHKLSVRYQLRRAAAYGEYTVVRQPTLRVRERPYAALVHLRELLRVSRIALSRARRPIRRWALDELEPAAVRFGMLRAVITGR